MKLVIFDLDGTILDTLQDLCDGVNTALSQTGYPTHTLEEVRSYVGNGIRNLIERSVPAGTEKEEIDRVHEAFTAHYSVHCADKTAPYPGVHSLLQALRENGYLTAVVSNKADYTVQNLCAQYFPGMFDAVAGEKTGIRRKPAPDSVNAILELLGVPRSEAVYVGDSDVDIATARNAEMPCLSVTYGFRDEPFLLAHGAVTLLHSTEELRDYLLLPPAVRRAMAMLQDAGYAAHIVGGCVRDRLLGKLPHDYDLTTSAKPEEMKCVFAGERLIETGLKHGTLTVLMDSLPLEITTYRLESTYSDHRHPDAVRFTDSLREDLIRRDFTINAMAAEQDGAVIDYFGGMADLQAKTIRCVGSPRDRFEEDALRLLRALRFAAVLDFTIEPETAAAIHDCRALLEKVSAERILTELKKLLCGTAVRRILLEYPDVLGVFLPELLPTVGFEQHNFHHIYDVWGHTAAAVEASPAVPALRFAALFHDIGKPDCYSLDENGIGHFYGHAQRSAEITEACLSRLKAERSLTDTVVKLVLHHDGPVPAEERLVKRAMNRLTPEHFLMLLELQQADTLALAPEFHDRLAHFDELREIYGHILAEAQCFSLRDLAVKGTDLIACGIPAGRQLGEILGRLLELVMDGKLDNNRESLLKAAAAIAAND